MSDPHYTIWWRDGRNRQEFLTEAQMREQAAKIGFDPDEINEYEQAHIWEVGVEPSIDPTKDEIAGGCFKTWYEFEVHYFRPPSRTRYKSPYSTDHIGFSELFQLEEEAFDAAIGLINDGYFDVSIQINELTHDNLVPNIEQLDCPYERAGVDQELQELKHHKQDIEDAMYANEKPVYAETYAETLAKINREIELITEASGAEVQS